MIIAISLGGLASYQLYMVTQNQQLIIQSQQNKSTLMLWKSMLISKAKAVGINNEIILPYGENKNNHHIVPSWVYFNTKNPWGQDFIYCPYSKNNQSFNASVKLNSTTSYNVQLLKSYATSFNNAQRDYVSSSTPNHISTDIKAFIISPTPSSSGILPSCNQIVYDSTNTIYKVNNGLVEVITNNDLDTFLQLANTNNANSGAFYTNTIQGDSSATNNTLNTNLAYLIGQDVAKAYLKLPAGTHNIQDTILNEFRDSNNDTPKVLVLEGDSSGGTIISTTASKSTLSFNNYKVTFRNVSLTNKIALDFEDSFLSSEFSTFSNLKLTNSSLKIKETTNISGSANINSVRKNAIVAVKSKIIVAPSKTLNIYEANTGNIADYALHLENSTATLSGTLNIYKNITNSPTILSYNSTLNLGSNSTGISSIINFEKNTVSTYRSDIELDNTSTFTLGAGSSVNLSGKSTYGIFNNGVVDSRNSKIITKEIGVNNSAIYLNSGGNLYMNGDSSSIVGNSDASKRPTYAIYDGGGRTIGGSGNTLYGKTNCYFGTLFTYSKANSSSNEFALLLAAEFRLFASQMNTSNWACVKG